MTKDWTINIGWLLCAVRYCDDLINQYILSITIFIINGSFHFSKVDHLPFFARSFTKNCLYAGHTPVRKIIDSEFLSLFKGWNPRWCRRPDSWWGARHCLGRRWRLDWPGGSFCLTLTLTLSIDWRKLLRSYTIASRLGNSLSFWRH